MKKGKKKIKKILSVILSILLFIGIVPVQVFAQAADALEQAVSVSEQETTLPEDTSSEELQPEILYEVTKERDAYKKVYKMSDGTYTAMLSSVPMHYQENGEWVEIDNTLETGDGNTLENKNNAFHVEFPDELTEETAVFVYKDGYEISFSVLGVANSRAELENQTLPQAETPADTVIQNLSTKVVYQNIFTNTDLEYTLNTNSVKENIIINSAAAALESYSFEIQAAGLTAFANEDGSICFKDSSSREVFRIPAPVMTDAANAVSQAITVSFSEKEAGGYLLTYSPSKEWLQDAARVYPVKLDPVIEEYPSTTEMRTFVSSAFPDENFYELYESVEITPENYSDFGEQITYILPFPMELPLNGAEVENITLSMRGQVNGIVGAYYITELWDATSVTYDSQPEIAENCVDYYYGEPNYYDDGSWVNFDITDVYQNYGVALRLIDDNPDWYAIFNKLMMEDQNAVFMYIEYAQPDAVDGFTDLSERIEVQAGRAGTAYVNAYSGSLSVLRDDLSISGNLMPAQISFAYKDCSTENLQYYRSAKSDFVDAKDCAFAYGTNWLSNYNQMFLINAESAENLQYMYRTAEGRYIPIKAYKENGKWIVEDDYVNIYGQSGYTFTIDQPENDASEFWQLFEQITVSTPEGYMQKYDANGRLVKIYKEKYPNQSIAIQYVSNLANDGNYYAIDFVTDGVGRKYDFTYSGGRLSSIQCFAQDGSAIMAGSTSEPLKMSYSYANDRLQTVTFPDGQSVHYSQTENIDSIQNIDGYIVSFDYTEERVSRIEETAHPKKASALTGNTIWMTYKENRVVQISDALTGDTYKKYDQYGRLEYAISENGVCQYYDYTNASDGLPTSSYYSASAGNLLENSSFESNVSGWQLQGLTDSDVVSGVADTGMKSLKILAGASGNKSVSQTIANASAGMYAFSAYVQSNNAESEGKLTMTLKALSASGDTLKQQTQDILAAATSFSQYTVLLEAPEETSALQVSISAENGEAAYFVDSLQLEKSSSASSHNYILNGSFQNGLNGWQHSESAPALVDETLLGKSIKAVCLRTEPMQSNQLSSEVVIHGKKDNVVTVGAWVKAEHMTLAPPECIFDQSQEKDIREASFSAAYSYTDENGTVQTEKATVSVHKHTNNWEYLQLSFVLLGDCDKITVSCFSQGIVSNLMFADFHVAKSVSVPEEPVEVPDEGTEQEEPATEPPAQETPAQDPATDLCVCGEDCAYGAGCPCDCTDAESCDCAACQKKFNITYDEFGNLLSVSIAGYDLTQLLQMCLSRTFTPNGNYLTSSTNESGGTVRYAYDQNNGALLSETDPLGNTTQYTYDAVQALKQVKTPVSGLAEEALGVLQPDALTASYGYENDRVVSITHNGYSYFIDYDAWGNVTRIYAGAVDAVTGAMLNTYVAEYSYGTGANRSRLESIQYGNGDTVHYRYDSANHITGISYDGGTTYRFTYGYDTLGNLTYIYDSAEQYIALYNETTVEIHRNGSLAYYASVDDNGNLTETVGNQFTYITTNEPSERNEETGVTSQKTTVSGTKSALELLKATDAFGRRQQQTTMLRDLTDTAETPSFAAVVTDYTYQNKQQNGTATATGRVDTLQNRVTYGTAMAAENTQAQYGFAYDYDANGNITEEYAVAADGTRTLRYRYTYDEAQQMTRVDDNVLGKTHVYQYDMGGNRVSEKIYAYTLGTVGGTPQQTITGVYGFSLSSVGSLFQNLRGWQDLLLTYNGKDIFYDRAGNPISYDGYEYEWAGKQLVKVTAPDGSHTEFSYDANGIRTQKRQYKADGTQEYYVDYIWQDGLLTQQTLYFYFEITIQGNTRTEKIPISSKFIYDESNQPVGCVTNGEMSYAFVRNLQGDIIAIVDQDGETLVEYSYDPWGKVTSTRNGENLTQLESSVIAVMCPFAYRGYNYDFTTGLYYLQSRYYNPEWGRFLNCDDTNILLATKGETLGANLFAYCKNNPVNRVDYTGYNSVGITIYGGAIGHAEMIINNTIFGYGVYSDAGYFRRATGCPASMIVSTNPEDWYAYDAQTNQNRSRKTYYIKTTFEEYIRLVLFYILVCGISVSQIDDVWYNPIDKAHPTSRTGFGQPSWSIYRFSFGPYSTYGVLFHNTCVTVVLDALQFAMPDKFFKAYTEYYNLCHKWYIVHPRELSIFAKLLSNISKERPS